MSVLKARGGISRVMAEQWRICQISETSERPDDRAVPTAALLRARLRLSQTRSVISRLGLGSKQCIQLTLLLGNKHADHLPAYLRHTHPTHVRNTRQPDQH